MTAPASARRAGDHRHGRPVGGRRPPVAVALRPTAALTGRLVTAAGEPLAKARVTAGFADASPWELSAIDRSVAAAVRTQC
jgi:hypothetical protein